ncbi:benzoate/H(+) symporter BenE family transporter [Sulfitobacter aestuarii]|uniref:Benzoate/H(+) symporter BenE family transporter n=1 Tax=Sulfitobacter aestuarii TaxID=2161676 RepID=A0ABW5TX08_9RHOB
MVFFPPAQTISTGLVVAIVGFFSSFPIILQGLVAMGADADQSASGLMAAALSMGLAGIALSLWKRQPTSVAWSTPGLALLAASALPEHGFAGAVAAFLFAGLLTVVSGLWRPLGRLAASIPAPLAQAMLAGVLLALCLVPFRALAEAPRHAVPILLTWFVVRLFSRPFAVPAAVIAAALVTLVAVEFQVPLPEQLISRPVWVTPEFHLGNILSIGVPLFIVTMATQNIPGIAILKSFGYTPPPGSLLASVGFASVVTAPFGSPQTCLAAITAAMCASEDSHPDRSLRFWSAVNGGIFYCLLGLFAGVITAFASLAPPMVLGTLAGVALLGVFANATFAALENPKYREAAAITFLVTASGITIFGLGAAVWGLLIGGLVQTVSQLRMR